MGVFGQWGLRDGEGESKGKRSYLCRWRGEEQRVRRRGSRIGGWRGGRGSCSVFVQGSPEKKEGGRLFDGYEGFEGLLDE